MDEVQDNAVQEVVTPQEQHQEAAQTPPADDRQERNWKAFRERQRQLEKELEEQRQMNQKLVQMASFPQKPAEPDELDKVADEDYINKGKVEKLIQKKAEQIAKHEVEKILQQRDKGQFRTRLKSEYSDFDDVVNPDTMALLEQQEPELAKAIVASGDPYTIGLQTYKYVKAFKLDEQVPSSRRAKEVDKKLADNAKTVVSPQAYDKRPMAKAYELTQADLKDLYKEMNKAASQVGFNY